MVCLGLEPGAAGWKVQTNPQSYGGTPYLPLVEDHRDQERLLFLSHNLISSSSTVVATTTTTTTHLGSCSIKNL